MTTPNDHNIHHTPSPRVCWAGCLSLAFATAGMILIFMGDTLWLSLPSSALGALVGMYALRREQETSVPAHLGLNLGIFNVFFLWPLLIVLMQYVFEMDISSLFEFPGPDSR